MSDSELSAFYALAQPILTTTAGGSFRHVQSADEKTEAQSGQAMHSGSYCDPRSV